MRPRHDSSPDLSTAAYMGHDLGAAYCQGFAVQAMRAYHESYTPERQRENLEHVRRLVAEHPHSYLARHYHAMYYDPHVQPSAKLRRMLGLA